MRQTPFGRLLGRTSRQIRSFRIHVKYMHRIKFWKNKKHTINKDYDRIDFGSSNNNYYCLSIYAEIFYKRHLHFLYIFISYLQKHVNCYTSKKKCLSLPQNFREYLWKAVDPCGKLNWEMYPEIARLTLTVECGNIQTKDLESAPHCLWKAI